MKNFQQLRRRAGGMLLSALLIAGSLGAIPPTIASAASNLAFRPVADAYVSASNPGANYGKSSSLRADASPNAHSYLRFNVKGLGGSHVQRAWLRIYSRSSSSSGLRVRTVPTNAWGEMSVTFKNRPPLGILVAGSRTVSSGKWVVINVTSRVHEPRGARPRRGGREADRRRGRADRVSCDFSLRALPGAARGREGRRLPVRRVRPAARGGRSDPAPRRRPLARRGPPDGRGRGGGRCLVDVVPDDALGLLQPRLGRRASARSRGCVSSAGGRASRGVAARRPRRAVRADRSRGTTPIPSTWRAPIDGATNVMTEPWFDPEHYRSDSNQHWRHGCPHEELAAGRVRVAPAADPSGDLGLRRRDDARDDGVVPRRRPSRAPRAACGRTGSTSREADHRRRHRRGRAGNGGAAARAARERRARGAARRHRHERALGRAAPLRRVPPRSGGISTRRFPDAMRDVAEREGADAILPQSSFDLEGLAGAARPLRRDRRCSSRRRTRSSARTTRRRRTRSCTGSGCRRRSSGACAARRRSRRRRGELGYPERAGVLQAGVLVGLARLPHPRPDRRPRRPAAARAAGLGVDAARGRGRDPRVGRRPAPSCS